MILYADGGTIGEINPSPYGVYWSFGVEDAYGFYLVDRRQQDTSYATNNEAEYLALIAALQYADTQVTCDDSVLIRMDSQLIVNQFSGRWRIKKANLERLFRIADEWRRRLKSLHTRVSLEWVPRDELVTRVGH